jgi:hypothetical protein
MLTLWRTILCTFVHKRAEVPGKRKFFFYFRKLRFFAKIVVNNPFREKCCENHSTLSVSANIIVKNNSLPILCKNTNFKLPRAFDSVLNIFPRKFLETKILAKICQRSMLSQYFHKNGSLLTCLIT